jgi:hypothetical protein
MRGLWRHFGDERGMVSVVAIFIMVILLVAGVFLVRMSSTEGDIAYSAMWAEGSFHAADAAINFGLDQLSPASSNPTATALSPAPPALGAFTPTGTIQFSGTTRQAGYSIGSGTGYNPGGFAFYTYALVGTGTGPRNAQRTLDVVASYGPVAQ